MNSDHAPTAEEQLPPLDVTEEDYRNAERAYGCRPTSLLPTRELQDLTMRRMSAEYLCRERQLLGALRENREKDARIAELEVLERTVKFMSDSYLEEHGNWGVCKWRVQSEAAEAKLRAVSDALETPDVQQATHEATTASIPFYWASEIDTLLARIRAIVDGK